MTALVYVALAPLAAILLLVVGLVAWRRRDVPGAWALVAFSLAEAGWLAFDTLSLVAPTSSAAVRLAQATFLWSPLLGVAWFAFVLSYTERFSRTARVAVAALTAWCLVYGGLALTNDAHRLVWSAWEVVPDEPFLVVRYVLGSLAWVQTGVMWAATLSSLGVLLWVYAGADARARSLSRWIVVGGLTPLAFNVVYLLGWGPIEKDFTPIVMAVSSGAFSLGLVRYRFLDLRPIARAALVDDLREGMLVLDAKGRVADVNPALRRAFGPDRAVLGLPLHETAPTLAHAIESATSASFTLGTGAAARFYDLRVSPLTDRAGRPSGRLVLLHDVTLRRREQAELRRANVDLQARNEELDAFAHTVAHDLKNSIQNVLGWSELLRDDGPELPPDVSREIADDVFGAALKMGSIVQEILLLAGVRQATVEPGPVDMGQVVEDALGRVQQSHDLSLAARPLAWPDALGHAPWLEEAWVNYLTNAAKYGGPTVSIGADTTASGDVRFWVHDDGPGLSEEARSRLFVPFSRVGTTDVEGHGLGLSIVRRITERLGGACGIESAPDWGNRFWFSLPAATAGAPPEARVLRAA